MNFMLWNRLNGDKDLGFVKVRDRNTKYFHRALTVRRRRNCLYFSLKEF